MVGRCLTWSHHHSAQVVTAWQNWAPSGPDALAASLLITAPADPAQPLQARVLGTLAGDGFHVQSLLSALVTAVGARPHSSWQRRSSWLDVRTWLNGPDANSAPPDAFSKSEFFRESLPASAVDKLITELADHRRPGEARELDFSPWAGAYNRVADHHTAFPHRREQFLLKHTATVYRETKITACSTDNWVTQSWQSVQPWGSRGVYPNFPDLELARHDRAYYGSNLSRIEQILTAYTPDLHHQQPIK